MTDEFQRTGRRAEARIDVSATPEACYAAWADPAGIARWFVDRAEGVAEEGSVVTWFWDAFGYQVPYEVLEAKPGDALTYGFRAPDRPPGVMEIRFTAKDGGGTTVHVVNHGFREVDGWDDEYEGVVSGWAMALATMKHSLEVHPGRDRRDVLAMVPASFSFDTITSWQRTPALLARWLGEGEVGAEVGAAASLDTEDLGPLRGRVLAATAIETLISWPEQDAVLGLKAFRMGPAGLAVALHASSWSWDAGQQDRHRPLLERSVTRLAEALASG